MTLDVCYGGCGGIWFDAQELERVSARAAATLHTIWNAPVTRVKQTEPRHCPRCPQIVLERKWFSDAKLVEIDQCPQCGGVWLDPGEFSRIYDEIQGAKVADLTNGKYTDHDAAAPLKKRDAFGTATGYTAPRVFRFGLRGEF